MTSADQCRVAIITISLIAISSLNLIISVSASNSTSTNPENSTSEPSNSLNLNLLNLDYIITRIKANNQVNGTSLRPALNSSQVNESLQQQAQNQAGLYGPGYGQQGGPYGGGPFGQGGGYNPLVLAALLRQRHQLLQGANNRNGNRGGGTGNRDQGLAGQDHVDEGGQQQGQPDYGLGYPVGNGVGPSGLDERQQYAALLAERQRQLSGGLTPGHLFGAGNGVGPGSYGNGGPFGPQAGLLNPYGHPGLGLGALAGGNQRFGQQRGGNRNNRRRPVTTTPAPDNSQDYDQNNGNGNGQEGGGQDNSGNDGNGQDNTDNNENNSGQTGNQDGQDQASDAQNQDYDQANGQNGNGQTNGNNQNNGQDNSGGGGDGGFPSDLFPPGILSAADIKEIQKGIQDQNKQEQEKQRQQQQEQQNSNNGQEGQDEGEQSGADGNTDGNADTGNQTTAATGKEEEITDKATTTTKDQKQFDDEVDQPDKVGRQPILPQIPVKEYKNYAQINPNSGGDYRAAGDSQVNSNNRPVGGYKSPLPVPAAESVDAARTNRDRYDRPDDRRRPLDIATTRQPSSNERYRPEDYTNDRNLNNRQRDNYRHDDRDHREHDDGRNSDRDEPRDRSRDNYNDVNRNDRRLGTRRGASQEYGRDRQASTDDERSPDRDRNSVPKLLAGVDYEKNDDTDDGLKNFRTLVSNGQIGRNPQLGREKLADNYRPGVEYSRDTNPRLLDNVNLGGQQRRSGQPNTDQTKRFRHVPENDLQLFGLPITGYRGDGDQFRGTTRPQYGRGNTIPGLTAGNGNSNYNSNRQPVDAVINSLTGRRQGNTANTAGLRSQVDYSPLDDANQGDRVRDYRANTDNGGYQGRAQDYTTTELEEQRRRDRQYRPENGGQTDDRRHLRETGSYQQRPRLVSDSADKRGNPFLTANGR